MLKCLESIGRFKKRLKIAKVTRSGSISTDSIVTIMEFMPQTYTNFMKFFTLSKRFMKLAGEERVMKLLENKDWSGFCRFKINRISPATITKCFAVAVELSKSNTQIFNSIVGKFRKVTMVLDSSVENDDMKKFIDNMKKWKGDKIEIMVKELDPFISLVKEFNKKNQGKICKMSDYVQKIKFALSVRHNHILFQRPSKFWNEMVTSDGIEVPVVELNVVFRFRGGNTNITSFDIKNFHSKKIIVKSKLISYKRLRTMLLPPRNINVNPKVELVSTSGPLIFHRDRHVKRSTELKVDLTNVRFFDQGKKYNYLCRNVFGKSYGPATCDPSFAVCSLSKSNPSIFQAVGYLKGGGVVAVDDISTLEAILMDTEEIDFRPSRIHLVRLSKPESFFKYLTEQSAKKINPTFSLLNNIRVCQCTVAEAITLLSLVGHFIWIKPIYVEFEDIIDSGMWEENSDVLELYKLFSNPKIKVSFSKRPNNHTFELKNCLKKSQMVERIEKNDSVFQRAHTILDFDKETKIKQILMN